MNFNYDPYTKIKKANPISTQDIIKDYVDFRKKQNISKSKEKSFTQNKLNKSDFNNSNVFDKNLAFEEKFIEDYNSKNLRKSEYYNLPLQNSNKSINHLNQNYKNNQSSQILQNNNDDNINENERDNHLINFSDKNFISNLKNNNLEVEILELRKKLKYIKKEDYTKKIFILEKEREEAKKSANHNILLCSQLAEEVIVLRNQLDNYSHYKK